MTSTDLHIAYRLDGNHWFGNFTNECSGKYIKWLEEKLLKIQGKLDEAEIEIRVIDEEDAAFDNMMRKYIE